MPYAESDAGPARGFGFLPRRVAKLGSEVKVPHMGWNKLASVGASAIFEPFAGRHFYFVHSYVCEAGDEAAAATDYGRPFVSAVEKGNVVGVQFHPEKSSRDGLALLRRLLKVLR